MNQLTSTGDALLRIKVQAGYAVKKSDFDARQETVANSATHPLALVRYY